MKAKCIILRSLDNVLQQQYVSIAMTYDILFNLQDMGSILEAVGLLIFLDKRL